LDGGALLSASIKKILPGRRTPTPVVWGELYGPGSEVTRAKMVTPEGTPPSRLALKWIILLLAVAAVLAVLVWA
jgi:hypothetical protein